MTKREEAKFFELIDELSMLLKSLPDKDKIKLPRASEEFSKKISIIRDNFLNKNENVARSGHDIGIIWQYIELDIINQFKFWRCDDYKR